MGVGAGLLLPLGAGELEFVVVLPLGLLLVDVDGLVELLPPELVPEDVDGLVLPLLGAGELELVELLPELLPEEVDGLVLVLPPEDPPEEDVVCSDVEGGGGASAEKAIVPSSGLRVRRSTASTDTTDFIRRRDRAEVHLGNFGYESIFIFLGLRWLLSSRRSR